MGVAGGGGWMCVELGACMMFGASRSTTDVGDGVLVLCGC